MQIEPGRHDEDTEWRNGNEDESESDSSDENDEKAEEMGSKTPDACDQ